MRFTPRFSITNAIAAALTEIERARGFLDAASLSDEWIDSMRSRAFLLEAHHTTHIEGTRLTIEEAADLLAGDDVPGADPDDTRELLNYRDAFKFARDWWHDDPVCLLPGEEGGHTVFVIEFYDGCKYFGYTRKSVVARVASLMSESGGWGSNAFVREHGGSVPYVVRCVASNMDQRQGRQLRDLLVARAPGDVYVAYGDPVQWVIGRNLHRRHLNGLRRASCVSAALEWAKQGQQQAMHTERDDSGKFSPVPANIAGTGEPVTQDEPESFNPEAEPEFFTQSERASLADVSERTQRMSDSYEKAGLGEEIRSGEISGAEADRKLSDSDTPKPPSRLQQLEMKLEAKALECQTEHLPAIDSLQRELREAKAQVSEYPHEREAVANEREAIISAQTSSIAELQTKVSDEKGRASWFEKQARSLGWEPTNNLQQELREATE